MQTVATYPPLYIASRRNQNIPRTQGPNSSLTHLALHTLEGIEMIAVREIIRAASDSNYCIIYNDQGQRVMTSRTLGRLEEILSRNGFTRIHKSHLVRSTAIHNPGKDEVILLNGERLPLSRHQRSQVLKYLQSFSAKL